MQQKSLLLSLLILANYFVVAQTPASLPTPYASDKKAFVRSWAPSAPETNAGNLNGKGVREVKQTTAYYDGAGRLIQTVLKDGTLSTGSVAVDRIVANRYDALGREQYQYLPFASTATDASKNNGQFKLNPFQQQAAFYNSQLAGQPAETNVGPDNLNWAYSQADFDGSPLNRVEYAYAPGSSWVGTSYFSQEENRRGIKTKYWINTVVDEVRIWNVTDPVSMGSFGSYNSTAEYSVGSLFKMVMIDERGKQVVEFKDKAGKLILKKIQLTAAADLGSGSGHAGWICTYYIYDNVGNLRCTVTPRAVESITGSWDLSDVNILSELCYRYEYDAENRQIIKKNPGAGEEYFVYDTRGRLAMRQDANMRAGNPAKWHVTFYDAFDRVVETGLWSDPNSLAYHITQTTPVDVPPGTEGDIILDDPTSGDYVAFNSITLEPGFETDGDPAFSASILPTYASGENYPFSQNNIPTSGYERLTRTGYDRYTTLPAGTGLTTTFDNSLTGNSNYFITSYNTSPEYAQPFTVTGQTRGLVTWTETKVLNSNPVTYLYSINYYDDKGRVLQVKSKNITGGVDIVTTQYGWDGRVLRGVNKQEKAGTPSQTSIVITKYTYDDLDRVSQVDKKVQHSLVNSNQLPVQWTTVSKHTYDALGQLGTKELGKRKDYLTGNYIGTPLETMDFDYNIRGWLLGMNRDYLAVEGQSGTTRFGFELGYDQLTNKTGQNFTQTAQLNGNITGFIWKSDGDDVRRKYDYKYDAVARMLKADFTQQNPNDHNWNSSQVNYSEQLGDGDNVSSAYDLNGNIKKLTRYGYSPSLSSGTPIDQLTYNYMNNNVSNRLLNVVDDMNNPSSFVKLDDFNTSPQHTSSKNVNTVDYVYDNNGNMIKDYNKDIVGYDEASGMTYNVLNLPELIRFKKDGSSNRGTIAYVYSAIGQRIQKVINEINVTVPLNGVDYTTNITTTVTYITSNIYESKVYSNATINAALGYADRLLSVNHEEGRIRFKQFNNTSSLHYDYYIKDHLGNIRMVLTEETSAPSVYEATMEPEVRTDEIQLFSRIPETEDNKPDGFDTDEENEKVIKLFNSSSADKRIGPAVVLKVMAGDKFKASVFGWYKSGSTNIAPLPGAVDIIYPLLSSITGGFTVGGKYSQMELGSGVLQGPIADFIGYQNGQNDGSRPKAYLSWMVLDDVQLKLVNGSYGATQVPTISTGMPKQVMQAAGGGEIEITKNGYLVVYVSNESQGNVYFDNLKVEHAQGPLTEESHYYAIGMQMKALSSQAILPGYNGNRFKYQGQEYESSLGLNLLEFEARMYDPQLGRWHVPDPANQFDAISPYAGMANNWPKYIDPDGRALPLLAIAAIVGVVTGAINVAVHWDDITAGGGFNWKKAGAAFGIGFVGGFVGTLTGGYALAGATAGGFGGIIGGAYSGMVGSAFSSPITGIGNAIVFGDEYSPEQWSRDIMFGGVSGGIMGGVSTKIGCPKCNILDGTPPPGTLPPPVDIKPTQVTTTTEDIIEAPIQTEKALAGGSATPQTPATTTTTTTTTTTANANANTQNYTKSNFRKNLIKKTGIDPGSSAQAHHDIPQKIRALMKSYQINVDDPKFGRWWTTLSHQQNAKAFNDYWDNFLIEFPKPKPSQVYRFVIEMRRRFPKGITGY